MTTNEILIKAHNKKTDSIDVSIQDQYSRIVDFYMINHATAISPTITTNSAIDTYVLTVGDTTGVTAQDAINIQQGGREMQALVVSKTATTITINVPLEFDVTDDAILYVGKWNMNVDGSTTRKVYSIKPPAGVKWDITRVNFSLNGTKKMDDTMFGSLAGPLAKGVVLRIKNGIYKNIFVVNNNGGFAERCTEAIYPESQKVDDFALRVSRDFKTQDGVTVRLNGDDNDELQVLIQDNLTDAKMLKFACVVHGHVVES